MSSKNQKIRPKLNGAFPGGVVLLLLISGLIGYWSLTSIAVKPDDVAQSTLLSSAAMKMKYVVTLDKLVVMDLLKSEDNILLEKAWKKHQKNTQSFDAYTNAILEENSVGDNTYYIAKDKKLRETVIKADKFHNDEFQPQIKKIHELKLEEFRVKKEFAKTMDRFVVDSEKVISLSEELERKIKMRIKNQMASGANNGIISTEETWIDMAMEMKATITMSRLFIEKHVKNVESESLFMMEKEYRNTIRKFDDYINALLNGEVTKEGRIAKVTVPELRKVISRLDNIHNELFQVDANALIALQTQLAKITVKRNESNLKTNEAGNKMIDLLVKVEETNFSDVIEREINEFPEMADRGIGIGNS